jgi:hypothetical protein
MEEGINSEGTTIRLMETIMILMVTQTGLQE